MIRRRDPIEMMLLGLCLLSGATYVAGADAPSSIEQTMPGWLVVAWNLFLTAAGAVGILGNAWPGQFDTALQIRVAGLFLVSGPAATYALVALSFAGWPALFPAGLVAAFAGACLWKVKHLSEDLKTLRGFR